LNDRHELTEKHEPKVVIKNFWKTKIKGKL